MAARGFQETAENGDRFLVLLNGRRYEGEAGHGGLQDLRVRALRGAHRDHGGARAARAHHQVARPRSTCCATRRPRNLAELSWRIGLPAAALILALLAIPLSFVNPRAGRSMNLVLALLIYMAYSNLLSIAQASIAQSRISFRAGTARRARR